MQNKDRAGTASCLYTPLLPSPPPFTRFIDSPASTISSNNEPCALAQPYPLPQSQTKRHRQEAETAQSSRSYEPKVSPAALPRHLAFFFFTKLIAVRNQTRPRVSNALIAHHLALRFNPHLPRLHLKNLASHLPFPYWHTRVKKFNRCSHRFYTVKKGNASIREKPNWKEHEKERSDDANLWGKRLWTTPQLSQSL